MKLYTLVVYGVAIVALLEALAPSLSSGMNRLRTSVEQYAQEAERWMQPDTVTPSPTDEVL